MVIARVRREYHPVATVLDRNLREIIINRETIFRYCLCHRKYSGRRIRAFASKGNCNLAKYQKLSLRVCPLFVFLEKSTLFSNKFNIDREYVGKVLSPVHVAFVIFGSCRQSLEFLDDSRYSKVLLLQSLQSRIVENCHPVNERRPNDSVTILSFERA